MAKKINSKKKGNRVELEVAKVLSDRFNQPFKRVPMSGAFGTLNVNQNIREDAMEVLSGDIIVPKRFKYSIEVKSRKSINFFDFFNEGAELHEWLDQCESDANKSDKLPMLIVKINYHEAFVMMKYPIAISEFRFKGWQIMTFKHALENDDQVFFSKNA